MKYTVLIGELNSTRIELGSDVRFPFVGHLPSSSSSFIDSVSRFLYHLCSPPPQFLYIDKIPDILFILVPKKTTNAGSSHGLSTSPMLARTIILQLNAVHVTCLPQLHYHSTYHIAYITCILFYREDGGE